METQTQELTQKKCKPCAGEEKPLAAAKVAELIKKVPQWQVNQDSTAISREYVMKNFMAAIKLINKVGELAEQEQHHPDIHLTGYRKLTIELSTHKIGGLSENDFILAAKINELPAELKQ